MPNRAYDRGAYYERRTMKTLEDLGYDVYRTAGSHGVFDVIAYNASFFRLIQVKSTLNNVKMGFYRKDIKSILSVSQPEACTKELWIYGKINNKKGVLKICVI